MLRVPQKVNSVGILMITGQRGNDGFIPECVARVPVSLGGLGVRLCSPSFAFATATVRNRSQPSA